MPSGKKPPNQKGYLPFKPLVDFQSPSLPTEETVRLIGRRIRKLFRKENNKPVITEDRLQRTLLKVLDKVVAPPAYGPLLQELELTVAGWVADPAPLRWTQLVVLPPGDVGDLIETWGREYGHQVLDSPSRESFTSPAPVALPELSGTGVLVIPQLERWFLRQRNGLTAVRSLLATVAAQERHCLIGCNSWAWAFLRRTVGAELILPEPLTFQVFDATRLYRWFSELSESSGTDKLSFRLSQNGQDVMETDENGKLKNDYFAKLAAQSLGIPWVAWHLWRRSLRTDREENDEAEQSNGPSGSDKETLWVVNTDEFNLPGKHQQTALLVLHALLIHGSLSADELRLVLPIVGESFIVDALISSGFVEQDGTRLHCRPIAYPAARGELFAAGFPTDRT